MATAMTQDGVVGDLTNALSCGRLKSLLQYVRARCPLGESVKPVNRVSGRQTPVGDMKWEEAISELEERVAELDGIVNRCSRYA